MEQTIECTTRPGLFARVKKGGPFATPSRYRVPQVTGPLPTVHLLAEQLCAQRGFCIETCSVAPTGSTVIAVEDLTFDRALVLLSLFSDARAYVREIPAESQTQARALGVRHLGNPLAYSAAQSLICDLSHGRVGIIDGAAFDELSKRRHLRSRAHRARVDINGHQVQVSFFEQPAVHPVVSRLNLSQAHQAISAMKA